MHLLLLLLVNNFSIAISSTIHMQNCSDQFVKTWFETQERAKGRLNSNKNCRWLESDPQGKKRQAQWCHGRMPQRKVSFQLLEFSRKLWPAFSASTRPINNWWPQELEPDRLLTVLNKTKAVVDIFRGSSVRCALVVESKRKGHSFQMVEICQELRSWCGVS